MPAFVRATLRITPRVLIASVLCSIALSVACGHSSPSAPTSPTAPADTPTRIISLSGSLTFGEVTVGSNATKSFTVQNSGNSALTVSSITAPSSIASVTAVSWTGGAIPAGGRQDVQVKFFPAAPQTYSGTIVVNGDQTSGANTIALSGTGTTPAGGLTTFGPGQYRVGTDIAAGRYFTDPASGCYWERESGFGGSLGEIIANDFVAYDAGQIVVDIASSDIGFKTDSDCRTWFPTPRRGFQSSITPGIWLVGSQVAPGTYRINAGAGCYWERLRDFGGTLDSIIDNDFSTSGGSEFITISLGDTGFSTDGDCGTWAPAQALGAQNTRLRRSAAQIDANWRRHRALHPSRR